MTYVRTSKLLSKKVSNHAAIFDRIEIGFAALMINKEQVKIVQEGLVDAEDINNFDLSTLVEVDKNSFDNLLAICYGHFPEAKAVHLVSFAIPKEDALKSYDMNLSREAALVYAQTAFELNERALIDMLEDNVQTRFEADELEKNKQIQEIKAGSSLATTILTEPKRMMSKIGSVASNTASSLGIAKASSAAAGLIKGVGSFISSKLSPSKSTTRASGSTERNQIIEEGGSFLITKEWKPIKNS